MTLLEFFNVVNLNNCRVVVHVHNSDPIKDFDSLKHSKTYLSVMACRDILTVEAKKDVAGTYLYIEVSSV